MLFEKGMMKGTPLVSAFFQAVTVAGTVALSVLPASADNDFSAILKSFRRGCSQIPMAQGGWFSDCSIRYTDAGQYLVERFHRNEEKRALRLKTYETLEKELRLYPR